MTHDEMAREIERLSGETAALQGIIVIMFQKMLAMPGGLSSLTIRTLNDAADFVEDVDTATAYKGLPRRQALATEVVKHIQAMVTGNTLRPKKEI